MSFKEKYNNFKKAAKEFWNENKTEIVCVGGFIFGSWLTYKLMKSDSQEIQPVVYQNPEPVEIPTRSKPEWNEEKMRNNWDWACELANNIKMEPGESYWIGDAATSHDDCSAIIGENFVCHLVDGDECYPDDVEDYEERYDPDNIEEDENDEIEIAVDKDADPEVKDVVRKFVMLANNNLVDVSRKVA